MLLLYQDHLSAIASALTILYSLDQAIISRPCEQAYDMTGG